MGNIITINRSKLFSSVVFIGQSFGIEEEDERALALTEVDLAKVTLWTPHQNDKEIYVHGEERLRRLKSVGHIRLDAMVLLILLENQNLIPENWKSKDISAIYFDGTVLFRRANGDRYALSLYQGVGGWRWDCLGLKHGCSHRCPSAVIVRP